MEAKKSREGFSKELRSIIVKLVIDGGKKSLEVAAEHGISVADIYAWGRQARVDAGDIESSRGTTSDRTEVARLRIALREREDELSFLKKCWSTSQFKRKRFAAIEAQIDTYCISVMCRLMEVSKSGFYWCRRMRAAIKTDPDACLTLHIKAIHVQHKGWYGSPRIHKVLAHQGLRVGKKRVERLMREHGLMGRTRRPFVCTTRTDARAKCAPNSIDRDFTASAPNQKWATDITCVETREEFSLSCYYSGFLLQSHRRLGHRRQHGSRLKHASFTDGALKPEFAQRLDAA